MENLKFADNIRALRKSKGLTQMELSKKISVSKQAIRKWENGVIPKGEYLIILSNFFEIGIDDLLGRPTAKKNIDNHLLPKDIKKNLDMLTQSIENFIRSSNE